MKSLSLRFLSILFVTGLLAAGAQAASFQAIDSNKDGKIDLSEVKPVAAWLGRVMVMTSALRLVDESP